MANAALQAVKNEQSTAVAKKEDPIGALMARLKPQLATALPAALNPERVARIALTELRQNPKLAEAALSNPLSFAGAMLRAATLGFEVGNGLGHAYLLPFEKRKKENNVWVTVSIETQLIIGYRGMIELSRRSGQIESLYAVEVYSGEPFEVTLGLSNDIEHKRRFDVDTSPDKVVAVYAVAKLKGGQVQFEVMGRNQVEQIRARSKSKDNGPWVTDWAEMAKKTVVRRLFKMLPVSIEVKTANDAKSVSLEQLANDDHGMTIDANTGQILTPNGDFDESQQPQSSSDERGQGDQSGGNVSWIAKIEAAQTVAELDEVYIRAEAECSKAELEPLMCAYREQKGKVSLI